MNRITIELCKEDRELLGAILDALLAKAPQAAEPTKYTGVAGVESIQDRLCKLVDDSGKSVAELVEETGIHKSTIYRYLSGEVEPKHEALRKLSEALGVSELYLLGYDVPAQRVTPQAAPATEPEPAPEPTPEPEPEPQPEPAPQHTRAELQHLVVTLTSAGKKAEVRAIVLAVAPKVSDIPEDKIDDVYEQLKALEG